MCSSKANRMELGVASAAGMLVLLLLGVMPAMAGIGGSDTPTWPGTAAVGDLIDASVRIINTSTNPNDTEDVTLTTLFVTPACADSSSPTCLAGNEDPGIFKVLSADGDPGTPPCAGISFTIGSPDVTTGEVALTPISTVTLGPANGPLANRTCDVNIVLRVFKVPANPAAGPDFTTDPLTRVALHGEGSGLNGNASGSAQITISKALPTVQTTAAPNTNNVVPGTSVTDTVKVVKAPGAVVPTGTVTFFLCQPSEVTAAGCPSGGTQIGAAKTLDAFGQATSDATTNTTAIGKYCWRAAYSGDANYDPASHTDASDECFTTVGQSTVETTSSPTGGGVTPGTSVTDSATVSGGGGPTPTGTVTFFLCQPNEVTGVGCPPATGTQIGAVKTLDGAGQATSDATTNTNAIGTYCWRVVYSGDANYNPAEHTNATSECFTTTVVTSEICRTPGFWGTRGCGTSGSLDTQDCEKPGRAHNITQLALNAALDKIGGGNLIICGEPINNTAVPDVASAIEAICVKPPTDPTNPLKAGRNLMVTALNCAVTNPTGPASVCDGVSIKDLFEACNTECATVAAGAGHVVEVTIGPDVINCNEALDCYNNGSVFHPDTGICGPELTGCHDETTTFVGFCSGSGELCSSNSPDCPAGQTCKLGPAGSPNACTEAKGNSCTIFSPSC